jgi:hypothetical protein
VTERGYSIFQTRWVINNGMVGKWVCECSEDLPTSGGYAINNGFLDNSGTF